MLTNTDRYLEIELKQIHMNVIVMRSQYETHQQKSQNPR